MSIQEIKEEVAALSATERRQLAAFLMTLRHRDLADYRERLSSKIDDDDPAHWLTLEQLVQRQGA